MKWKSIDLSSKLSLTYGGNVNYYKSVHHPISILPVGTGTPWQFSKQISKLSFPLSSRYFLFLPKLKGKERPSLDGGCKKGDHIVRLSPRALVCHEGWKSLSFCEIWNNPTPPLCFYQTPLQISTARYGTHEQIPRPVKSKESCCQQGKGLIIII